MIMEQKLEINRFKIFSSSALKLIAIAAMLSGHITKFYFYHFTRTMATWPTATLFTIAGRPISFYMLLLMFGRFAFPLFAFMLVIGFEKTRNRKKYGLRLFFLALISEIPFDLMVSHSLWDPGHNNVIFTLLMGYLAMCSLEYFKQNKIVSFLIVVGLYLLSRHFNADYRTAGYLFILVLYGLRKEKILQCLIPSAFLPMKFMVFLSLVLTCFYNGQRGFLKSPFWKYFFDLFYPIHMLIIYLLAR